MEENPQLELANNLVQYTDTHLFLTGKAGTGKTTFLKNLKLSTPKRMIVVAPTGVAAINAGGVTIHSFFQLGFAPFVPGVSLSKEFFRFNKEKINIIRSLDLLVIDEISMVRADLLDAVDNVLRYFRKSDIPFGGIQILMIGDLQQLAPVVKEEEWNLLKSYYESPFFFNSKALKKTSFVCIELKKVYRQADETFVNMLNCIREGNTNTTFLAELNKRYDPFLKPKEDEGYIILTTHNSRAQEINREKLNEIEGKLYEYKARITGNFPEYAYPTDAKLELRKGAQVMFVRNDTSSEKRYFNGKIGVITDINDDKIEVWSSSDPKPVRVEKSRWSNTKYTIDPETKDLVEEEEGAFEQYPLRTAWAITVHKSQGLTFDKAIIDVSSSFAHGQVYVALSRCRTLEGLVLSSKITEQSIIKNKEITFFTQEAEEREPNEQILKRLCNDYFIKMLFEQFSYDYLQRHLAMYVRLLDEYFYNLYPELLAQYKRAETLFKEEVLQVSVQFQLQLQKILGQAEDVWKDVFLQERIKKAAVYFLEKINSIFSELLQKTEIETDSKEVRKKINDAFLSLQKEILIKRKTLEICVDGFSVSKYLNAKSKSAIEDDLVLEKKRTKSVKNNNIPKDILHPELYAKLRSWRAQQAKEQNLPVYLVLSQMALVGITNLLPLDSKKLLQIPGIGKVIASRYGQDILNMVEEAVRLYKYELQELIIEPEKLKEKEPKIDTKEQSFLLFKAGKSPEEIAKERSLAISTIEGHLLIYLKKGEISIDALMSHGKSEKIKTVLRQHSESSLSQIKEILGEKYSWSEIRFVKTVLDNEKENSEK